MLASPELLTPHPLSTQRVCPPSAPKAGGILTPRAVRGCGVNISEDARHWIGLLHYNPSTATGIGDRQSPMSISTVTAILIKKNTHACIILAMLNIPIAGGHFFNSLIKRNLCIKFVIEYMKHYTSKKLQNVDIWSKF